jgi:DNA-dependent RNA polymerase auxiliary subunit epsilon
VEVRTPFGAEYAVRARLEKNKLNLQFVKYRDSQDSPSDYEKTPGQRNSAPLVC